MIHIFSDFEKLANTAASYIAEIGRKKSVDQGMFYFVLSGGKTPEKVYRKLADQTRNDLAMWTKTMVFWGDERCVPPNDPYSNYGMANNALLNNVPILSNHIFRIEAELPDLEPVIRNYEKKFPEEPDLILLGMGSDGHIASLFPHSPSIMMKDKFFVYTEGKSEPIRRITMTPKVLESAEHVLILVSGALKAKSLINVFENEGTVGRTPARLVRHRTWYVDREAAHVLVGSGYVKDEIIERE